MKTKKQQVADYLKFNVDWARFARLTRALGNQANNAQFRFLKATIFEQSIEEYSKGKIKYVGQDGCDHIISQPTLSARIEMKYTEGALYTTSKKLLRESTGGIKLMNSMGTNTHKTLPATYADFLLFVAIKEPCYLIVPPLRHISLLAEMESLPISLPRKAS